MQRNTVSTILFSLFLVVFAVPATAELIYVVGDNNTLISFDHETPGTIVSSVAITGTGPGELIRGIDFRPASGQLYALGSGLHLYRIDVTTGVATQVGTTLSTSLVGLNVGFDFNPTADRIRVTTDQRENIRLHPDTGALAASDTLLAYAPGDVNAAQTPQVVAVAYTNSIAFSPSTTLYGIDAGLDNLVRHGSLSSSPISPNMGQLFTVGGLGVNAGPDTTFDISSASTGRAFMTVRNLTGGTDFYEVDLSTGQATRRNTISGTTQVFGMTAAQASVVYTVPIIGNAPGQNNTSFRGDLNIINSSAFPATVTIDFFESGVAARSAPTASETITLAAGEFRQLNDVIGTLFGRNPGTGALRISASRPVSIVGRIYNQTATGTFGQFIRAAEVGDRQSSGVLAGLKNTPANLSTGFRTNVGWFNPNSQEIVATFTARGLNGATLAGPVTVNIPAFTQSQLALNQLFPTLALGVDAYVTFTTVFAGTTTPGPLFVYASVVDNATGDAIYIPALRNN